MHRFWRPVAIIGLAAIAGTVAVLIISRAHASTANVAQIQAITIATQHFAARAPNQSSTVIRVIYVHFQASRNEVRDSDGALVFSESQSCIPLLGCEQRPIWLVELSAQGGTSCSQLTGDVVIDAVTANVIGDSILCQAGGGT
jgi:hypothetical protein